ncbi:MAG TPA: site-2 protease family protein [Actinomycetota bacterium]|nr:site-2 protease family protein [Actinomycetota bacterium]
MLPFLIGRDYTGFIIIGVVLVVAICLHEFGHAVADDLQGDPTARLAGRLTIDPRAHLDPFGALMIVLVGFGWGKPVPMSPNSMRSRRYGAAFVGIAGPLVNIILAVATALLARVLRIPLVIGFGAMPGFSLASQFASAFLYINVLLVILNLIPIPPLDGSRVLGSLLPPDKQRFIYFMDQWGFLILLIAALLVLPHLLPPVANSGERWLLNLIGFHEA